MKRDSDRDKLRHVEAMAQQLKTIRDERRAGEREPSLLARAAGLLAPAVSALRRWRRPRQDPKRPD